MQIEAGKTYRTRNGSVARIYSTDGSKPFSIHGAVSENGAPFEAIAWSSEGKYMLDVLTYQLTPEYVLGYESDWDLMEPKQSQTRYVFLYEDGIVGMSEYPSLYRSGCKVVATAVVHLVEDEFGFELPLKRADKGESK